MKLAKSQLKKMIKEGLQEATVGKPASPFSGGAMAISPEQKAQAWRADAIPEILALMFPLGKGGTDEQKEATVEMLENMDNETLKKFWAQWAREREDLEEATKFKMKITKSQLKQIIKEELNNMLKERAYAKDYIKDGSPIHSSIPPGSLSNVLRNNPELRDQLHSALAAARGDASRIPAAIPLIDKVAQLLAQDPDIVRYIGEDPIENHLDMRGFLAYAEQNMPYLWGGAA